MGSNIIKRALLGQFVLIAEIGVNYYDIAREQGISLMEAAKMMILEAKKSGVHAVKFQTYKADTLAAKDAPSYWDTSEESIRSQYELFCKYDHFGREEYQELRDYCCKIGIEFLSTAFDFESADYLGSMMEVYKISSSDLTNLPFVEYQAKKNKPILLSVGASNADEIDRAVTVIRKYNHQPLVLLHCVLEYPTPYEHANLNKIIALRQRYPELLAGYSDHTRPDPNYEIIKTAYLLGAVIVEKHFTLNKNLKGNDHYHAMDPDDAANICREIEYLNTICGSGKLICLDSEAPARRNARRSIVALKEIPAGAIITSELLTYKRPGTGISPAQSQMVIGRKAKRTIMEDTILTAEMFE